MNRDERILKFAVMMVGYGVDLDTTLSLSREYIDLQERLRGCDVRREHRIALGMTDAFPDDHDYRGAHYKYRTLLDSKIETLRAEIIDACRSAGIRGATIKRLASDFAPTYLPEYRKLRYVSQIVNARSGYPYGSIRTHSLPAQ